MSSEPLTITAAAPLIRSGEFTPSELLEQCLRRIDIYEPAVKAWAYLDRERARQDAARATDEIKAGHYRGPLHGIPVGIKDIIDVFDMPTGCGSKLWANSYARRDATCVERLRQAGAVILGKTVTTAYAYLDPPVTRNPWNLERTPGGSSSGSAAAVACGMCLASLGTQTGGSTIRPASYCGVCSLKPTWGRISVDGVLPLAPSLDHIGIMANCVRDLAVMYQTIAGGDFHLSVDEPIPDCVHAVDNRIWSHTFVKLGGLFDEVISPEAAELMDGIVQRIEGNWSEVERAVLPGSWQEQLRAHKFVMAAEAAQVHSERLARHQDDYPAKIRQLVEEGRDTWPDPVASGSYRMQDELRRAVPAQLSQRRFFITPATPDLPPTPETTGNPMFNAIWSFVGAPVVSVPLARSASGLPFAVQLVGKPNQEDHLLRAALWCEEEFALPRRLPPVPAA